MGTGGLAQGMVALASEEEQDWGILPAPRSWPRDDARKQADKIQLSERAQGGGEEGRRPAGVRVWLLTPSAGGQAGRDHSITRSLSLEMAALELKQPVWILVPALPLLATGENELTSLVLSFFITQTGTIIVPAS